MRILMINHFPLEGSGSGTYTKNLAMQLVGLGHEVVVILPQNSDRFPTYEGIRLHPVYFTPDDYPANLPKGALPFNFPCFTTHPVSTTSFGDLSPEQLDAYVAAFKAAIEEEVAEFKPDVIHGQHVWILSSLAAGLGVPLVLTAHGTDLMGCDKWPRLHEYPERALEAASAVICISRDNEELVRSMFPQHADKVVRMRNGYNPEIFLPMELDRAGVLKSHGIGYEGEHIVLFAGKLTNFKGVDVLLDAAAIFEQEIDDVLLLIAGDGELRDSLHAQAKRLGLSSIHFLGSVPQGELARLYNIADVDIVPSRREPFGLVAVEAMACGTPVVATDEGGLPDFINDSVGALVPVDDSESLAKAIISTLARTLDSPSWRGDIAAYASENYSQAVIISELVSLYERVI